jgi:hypothetical protein
MEHDHWFGIQNSVAGLVFDQLRAYPLEIGDAADALVDWWTRQELGQITEFVKARKREPGPPGKLDQCAGADGAGKMEVQMRLGQRANPLVRDRSACIHWFTAYAATY